MVADGSLPLEARVRDTERTPTSFVLPKACSARLDWLVDEAVEAGESRRLSRTELLAALIVSASPDGGELRRMLETFRTSTVRDLVLGGESLDDEKVISLAAHRPGPRAR